jgi:5-(carboxyamino)imidazole ribonucleotide synthase
MDSTADMRIDSHSARCLPGATGADGSAIMLGVTGGGQLGRMFVHAAQALGFRVAVLDPAADGPAAQAADVHIQAAYDDPAAWRELARQCAAVTTEFENVPAATLRALAEWLPVAPEAASVEVCQRRLAEKQHFIDTGVPCAPFAAIDSPAAVAADHAGLLPGILKTTQLGYDGKGQRSVDDAAGLAAAWQQLQHAPCVLERRLPLHRELSVIVARGRDDQVVHLPVQQNLHQGGILAITEVPASDIPAHTAAQAVAHAVALARSLRHVGVLCVEFFLLADGSLVANEMAPRPHNSGHYSIDACDVSQFDLQVRTLAGLPLVQPRQHSAAVMLNLLGELWFTTGDGDNGPCSPDWAALLALPGVHLHLYGKTEPRPGRKMGHLTVTAPDAAAARAVALQVAQRLGLPAF